MPSLTTILVIVVAVIIGDVFSIGVQPNTTWKSLGNSNYNAPLNGPQFNTNSKTTTPWPALGQRRNQPQNIAQNVRPSSQPMWVLPENGRNWVRNTPTPIRNSPNNANTNFLNNERGGNQNLNNQRPNSNIPTQGQKGSGIVQAANTGKVITGSANNPAQSQKGSGNVQLMNTGQMAGGGGNKNSNVNRNNANGMIPTGSFTSNSGSSTNNGPVSSNQNQNLNEGSNKQSNDGGNVEDYELREFSEELLTKDTNNVARFVTVNVQGMTTSRSTNDEAPLPLLSIDNKAFAVPSIEKLMLLYNNYIVESNQNEVYTAQEKIEENNLLDTILSTSVMQHTRNFLIRKGKLGRDPKDFKDLLRSIWFGMYSRGQGRIGSSGFEHVFLAELKNNQVSGLHNWLYFNEEEKNNRANYLGYMRKIDLGTKGSILKYHFTFRGVDKPVGSMFIGTSPELEIALYSTCFILRADRVCPLKMGGNKFIIRTFTYRYRGKNMIGSAFPEI